MKRVLWMAPMVFVLMSGSARADSITRLAFEPNFGGGENFFYFNQTDEGTVQVGGGTPFEFYQSTFGYPPGSTIGGTTELFFDGGSVKFGSEVHELANNGTGSLFLTQFMLPTNGQAAFTVPVDISFSFPNTFLADTGEPFAVGDGARGTMSFVLDFDGYRPDGGFRQNPPVPLVTPELNSLALIGTGLIGILSFARKRLTIH